MVQSGFVCMYVCVCGRAEAVGKGEFKGGWTDGRTERRDTLFFFRASRGSPDAIGSQEQSLC